MSHLHTLATFLLHAAPDFFTFIVSVREFAAAVWSEAAGTRNSLVDLSNHLLLRSSDSGMLLWNSCIAEEIYIFVFCVFWGVRTQCRPAYKLDF